MGLEKEKPQEEASIICFYKVVLGWDYFHLLEEFEKIDKKNAKAVGAELGLKQVKGTYDDVHDYLATFEPLLFEEVKAQIFQNKKVVKAQKSKRVSVMECREADEFHLPSIAYYSGKEESVSPKDQADELHLTPVTYEVDKWESISPNDLLLLSTEKDPNKPTNAFGTYAFALVEHSQADSLRLKMYLAGEVMHINKDAVKSQRLLNMLSLITSSVGPVKKQLYSRKICSLSTIAREYVALRSIGSLPFKDLILTATEKVSAFQDQSWKIPGPLNDYIKENHNMSQLEAIYEGLSRKPLVLIQGPPGTGKTQTILGLLSAILHATRAKMHSKCGLLQMKRGRELPILEKCGLREIKRGRELPIHEKYNHWGRASSWLVGANPRDNFMPVDGDDGFFSSTGNDLKPEVVNSSRKYRLRVLVCAPSNSALDEIVSRLLHTGVRDENVRTYTPKVVRIGLKAHHSVKSVDMDHLVKQKLGGTIKDKDKDSIRSAILNEAVIVCSTLSFSGSSLLRKLNHGFDIVIIDEAAQAVEPATLVPFVTGCKQVFLVGDPFQLPATVISTVAESYGYGTSLFKRLYDAGYPVKMLKTQYRMHPKISSFPSEKFYKGKLEDGSDVKCHTTREWHEYRCFGPFCFFDIHEGAESLDSGSGSFINEYEVDFVLQLHHKLVSMYPELKSSSQLAIISPYRGQVEQFEGRFNETLNGVESRDEVVDITTVDGCQGREKDVVIISCVRANKAKRGNIGFVKDSSRMNVAITRGKSCVLVVGSASTLRKSDEHWESLIQRAESEGCLFKVSRPYDLFFRDENLQSQRVNWDTEAQAAESDMVVNGNDHHQGQADDTDYGDGCAELDMDMDMDDHVGFEED